MAVVNAFLPAFCQFGVMTSVLWNQLASNLVLALSFCGSCKISMGSMVQIFPQHVTTVHVLFPATGKRAPMHQQDFMPFKPSLEVDNQTLSEKAYAFILPF